MMRARMRRSLPLVIGTLVAAVTLAACGGPGDASTVVVVDAATHRAEVEAWRQWRHDELMRPDGWLSLVGLMWLETGEATFGSDPANDLVYDGSGTPSRLGVFRQAEGAVRFEAEPGAGVTRLDGTPVDSVLLWSEDLGEAPVLAWGPLQWHIIRRDGRLAVRLRDAESPVRTGFEGVANFPVSAEWRLEGRFEAYDPPKKIMIPNILGTIGENDSPAAAVFEVDGRNYRLDLWKDSDDPANFFTAFGDETNGDATYGGGRFLWIDAPDDAGRIVVDFNRAYNPPCVFTPYATCPLPPEQNRLPLAIEAGEKHWKTPSAPQPGG